MKKVTLVTKALFLFVMIPLEISKGSKQRMYSKVKKHLKSANLF